ncbi:MAG: prephenate dehydratase [Candidatus Egerieousia sp.]
MRKVLIQGISGCNHYIAAKEYFAGEEVETIDCETFKELASKVASDSELCGLMAVENTIAGSLLQNFRLICNYNLKVIGEYKLRIKHSLVALPGVSLDDIKEVNSHPMALMQCAEYLENLKHAKLVEKDDTAASAKWIKENDLRDHAAICPKQAAELYGLNVLADGIETNKRNFTRFVVVANRDAATSLDLANINKSSIAFTLSHSTGSLSKVLTILSFYDMNLSMIQSLPVVGKEWEYQFYINLLFDNFDRYRQAVSAITPLIGELQILGEYEDGKQNVG